MDDEDDVARRAFARDESRLAGGAPRAEEGRRGARAVRTMKLMRRGERADQRTAEPLGRTEGVVGVPEHRVHGGKSFASSSPW